MTTDNTEWQETQQLVPNVAQVPTDATSPEEAGDTVRGQQADDFAHTEVLPNADDDPRLWSESTDGRCSEDAALFAASQPAPLSVV